MYHWKQHVHVSIKATMQINVSIKQYTNECVITTTYKWMCMETNVSLTITHKLMSLITTWKWMSLTTTYKWMCHNNIQMNAYSAILQAHSALLKTKQRNYKVTYWHKLLRLSLIKRPYGGSETREGWVGWECMLTFHILSQHIFSYSPARNHTLFSPLSQPRQQTPGAHAILPV